MSTKVGSLTVQEIEKALESVIDPCSKALGSPMDIVTMGLVEKIVIDGGDITITVILTDAACYFFTAIEKFVADVLIDLPGVQSVDVQISSTTLWSPDRVRRSLPLA